MTTPADQPVDALLRFLREHPDLPAETRSAIRRAPAEVNTSRDPYGLDMRQYDPTRYHWSAEQVWTGNPAECRECYEPRPYPPGQRHFGWALWRTCKMDDCRHEHHASEVWIG